MEKGWRALANWKLFAVAAELSVAGGCVALGWQVARQPPPVAPPKVHHAVAALAPVAPVTLPLPVSPVQPASTPRVGLSDLARRFNADDAGLYRAQWEAVQVLSAGTRQFLERQVLPLLLAAARGGGH